MPSSLQAGKDFVATTKMNGSIGFGLRNNIKVNAGNNRLSRCGRGIGSFIFMVEKSN